MTPEKGKHPMYCGSCGKLCGEVIHFGGEEELQECEYCKDAHIECPECYLTRPT